MRVILLSDVDKLGLRGDLVNVAPGYARNYLLPRRLAERATAGRVADLQRRDELRARQEARTVEHAREIADTLTKTVLRFEVKSGPTGALFGSVTPTDIADEIWRTRRVRVDRRKIDLPDPIKRIGRYEVPVDVFEDVRVEVKTLVVPEGGELPPEEELIAVEPEEELVAVVPEGEQRAAEAEGDQPTVEASDGGEVVEPPVTGDVAVPPTEAEAPAQPNE
jgi:large subunit ribosomal protein L9